MDKPLVLALVVALGFGIWPVIARSSQLNAWWIFTVVSAMQLLVAVICLTAIKNTPPATKSLLIGMMAGFVAAVALLGYSRLLAGGIGKEWNISRLLPIISAMTPVVASIGAYLAFQEEITIKKLGGIILVIIAIILLS